jgi:hypothetical protein
VDYQTIDRAFYVLTALSFALAIALIVSLY